MRLPILGLALVIGGCVVPWDPSAEAPVETDDPEDEVTDTEPEPVESDPPETDTTPTGDSGSGGDGGDDGPAYDTCGEVQGATPLAEGTYTGDLTGFQRHLDVLARHCEGMGSSDGPEAFFKIQVPPRSRLNATFGLRRQDATVYVVADCGDPTSCYVGSDQYGDDGIEGVALPNPTDTPQTAYLVGGLYDDGEDPGTFTLGLQITPLE